MKADVDPEQLQIELKHFAVRNPNAKAVTVFVEDDNGTFAVLAQPDLGKPMCFDILPQDRPQEEWEDAADQLAQAFARQGRFAASRGPATTRPPARSYTAPQLVLDLIKAHWDSTVSARSLQALIDADPESARWALVEMGQEPTPQGLKNAAQHVLAEAREALDSD